MFIAVYAMYERCELHDIFPCAICNGDDRKLQDSLRDEWGSGARVAPGVVLARMPGRCAACGQNFGVESPIRYDDDAAGWVAMGCCG